MKTTIRTFEQLQNAMQTSTLYRSYSNGRCYVRDAAAGTVTVARPLVERLLAKGTLEMLPYDDMVYAAQFRLTPDNAVAIERQATEFRRCWSVDALRKLNQALTDEYLKRGAEDWPVEFANLKTALLTALEDRR